MFLLQNFWFQSPSDSQNASVRALDGSNTLAIEQSLPIISRILAASVGTQGTMGGLILAGFVSIDKMYYEHSCD